MLGVAIVFDLFIHRLQEGERGAVHVVGSSLCLTLLEAHEINHGSGVPGASLEPPQAEKLVPVPSHLRAPSLLPLIQYVYPLVVHMPKESHCTRPQKAHVGISSKTSSSGLGGTGSIGGGNGQMTFQDGTLPQTAEVLRPLCPL